MFSSLWGRKSKARKADTSSTLKNQRGLKASQKEQQELKEKCKDERRRPSRSATGQFIEDSTEDLALKEKRHDAKRIVRALCSWRIEARQFVHLFHPRRPLLLLEAWLMDGDEPSMLLGEQWVPYEATRQVESGGCNWNLALVPRLSFSRYGSTKPFPWPQINEGEHTAEPPLVMSESDERTTAADSKTSTSSAWFVKVWIGHTCFDPHDCSPFGIPYEQFDFKMLSITRRADSEEEHEDFGEDEEEEHASDSEDDEDEDFPTVQLALWRWGGDPVFLPEQNVEKSPCGKGVVVDSPFHSRPLSLKSADESWSLLFKSGHITLKSAELYDERQEETCIEREIDDNLYGKVPPPQTCCMKLRLILGIGKAEEVTQFRRNEELLRLKREDDEMRAQVEKLRMQVDAARNLETRLRSELLKVNNQANSMQSEEAEETARSKAEESDLARLLANEEARKALPRNTVYNDENLF